jgi:hypothetical protein
MRDGCAHRILSVHLDPLPSAAVTTSGMHPSPRALALATSIGWRHAAADPVRALLLAWRVLPAPLRGWLRLAGPYGRAAVLWGAGERDAALASLGGSPRRLAAFALPRISPPRRQPPWTGSPGTTGAAPSRLPAWPGAKAASPKPCKPSTTPPAAKPAASAPPSPPSKAS